ncbi:MAG: FAD-dependent oxidoreductase [Bacteroidia bacterium]
MSELKTDVVVVGAGAAGVAASIAAAREGLGVVLLEKNSFPGGRATASAVGTICGLYLRSFKHEAKFVAEGFMKEFAEKLQQRSAAKPQGGANGLYYLPYNPFDFKTVCDELLAKNGIQPYYHATVYDVETDNDKVTAVEAFVYDRKLKFIANAFIDCSGEASVCYLAGETVVEEKEYQASAQVFTVENIETSLPESLGFHVARELKRAVNDGRLSAELQWVSVVPDSFHNKSAMLKIGIPLTIDNSDNKATEVELAARKSVNDVFDYLKNNVEAFRNAHISFVATEAGLRTGRRPMGKYTLTETDVLDCRKFDDNIANGAWPVEFWGNDNKVKMDYFTEDDFYQIPARCLQSTRFSNLFFAGKNISATEKAIASARVIGTCLQTGWAAGKLAAV